MPRQVVLYQHAAYLPVFPIDIVRPFHRYIVDILIECLFYAERSYLGNQELTVGRKEVRIKDHTEHQVPAIFRLP